MMECGCLYTGGFVADTDKAKGKAVHAACKFEIGLGGCFSILSLSCVMWTGTLDSSDFLLSYRVISLPSHITIILISTLFQTF